MTGQTEEVQSFLAQGVNANATGGRGTTALLLAAAHNRVNIMEMLVEAGRVWIRRTISKGRTPLVFAVAHGTTAAVEWLLARGADWRNAGPLHNATNTETRFRLQKYCRHGC